LFSFEILTKVKNECKCDSLRTELGKVKNDCNKMNQNSTLQIQHQDFSTKKEKELKDLQIALSKKDEEILKLIKSIDSIGHKNSIVPSQSLPIFSSIQILVKMIQDYADNLQINFVVERILTILFNHFGLEGIVEVIYKAWKMDSLKIS
jgi:hypothetical protein